MHMITHLIRTVETHQLLPNMSFLAAIKGVRIMHVEATTIAYGLIESDLLP